MDEYIKIKKKTVMNIAMVLICILITIATSVLSELFKEFEYMFGAWGGMAIAIIFCKKGWL
jgi:hypothetical protein